MRRALGLGLLLASGAASADTLYWLGAKLSNSPTQPMHYSVDETQSSPAGIPRAEVEALTQQAYQNWQDVSCAYITFQFDGAITSAANLGTHADTKSVMSSFVSSRDDSRYDDDLGGGVAVGVALTLKNNGVIQGCDTEFNSADWTFATDGNANAMDFLSLANHENGHCLGLDHDPNDFTSVMYPGVANGDNRRTLDAHDIDNVCQLYPETGSQGSPCAASSCGAGLTCIQDNGAYCSHGCDVANPGTCEAGFGCKASTAISGQTGVCFRGAGDNSALVGHACGADADCGAASAVCFTQADNHFPLGYCSQACDPARATSCPTGNTCVTFGAVGSFCLASCSALTSGACRADYACSPVDAAGNGFCYPACNAVLGTQPLGCGSTNGVADACECNGVCYPQGNPQAFIGSACNHNVDCPTGSFCIPQTLASGAASGWPAGYCAAACGGGNSCLVCPGGSACITSGAEGQAYCLETCGAHGGCRSGYTCAHQGQGAYVGDVCVPGCQSDSACAVGERCVGGTCLRPGQDAGCALCGDGGIQVTTTSGTTGTSQPPATPSGCGCQTRTDPGWALLGLLLTRKRSRR